MPVQEFCTCVLYSMVHSQKERHLSFVRSQIFNDMHAKVETSAVCIDSNTQFPITANTIHQDGKSRTVYTLQAYLSGDKPDKVCQIGLQSLLAGLHFAAVPTEV